MIPATPLKQYQVRCRTGCSLSVHHKGHGVAGVYTKDVAETKVAQVTDHAKEQGMPLRLSVEPE